MISTRALRLLLVLWGLAPQNTAHDMAVAQMRHVAAAMKACPEETRSQTEYAIFHVGPPTNLEWNVEESKTVRSPFQGIVKFALPERVEESERAKHSKKLHDQYMDATIAQQAYRKDVYYQYEFDLGNGNAELVKMLVLDSRTKESKAVTSDHSCWQEAARTPSVK
jgi:hypothetical protein